MLNGLGEGTRPSVGQMLQPVGWQESADDEVKLRVVLNPLVPKMESSLSVRLLPQLGQTSSL